MITQELVQNVFEAECRRLEYEFLRHGTVLPQIVYCQTVNEYVNTVGNYDIMYTQKTGTYVSPRKDTESLATYFFMNHTITVNVERVILHARNERDVKLVVLHELAHAFFGPRALDYQHDDIWAAKSVEFGGTSESHVKLDASGKMYD